jgi:hypothetical protein
MKKTQYEYDNNMILNTCINLENKERTKLNLYYYNTSLHSVENIC